MNDLFNWRISTTPVVFESIIILLEARSSVMERIPSTELHTIHPHIQDEHPRHSPSKLRSLYDDAAMLTLDLPDG